MLTKMKTLNNHTLIYDAACPLCNAYTHGFIQYNMLDKRGRIPYENFNFVQHTAISQILACNKIALVNTKTNEATYGIGALIKIISHRFPTAGKIAKWSFVYFLLTHLYALISYNRKVIMPHENIAIDNCKPSINVAYRIAYIVLSAAIVHLTVTWFFTTFLAAHINYKFYMPDFVLFIFQLPFQYLAFVFFNQKNFYDYAGNIATISLFGALLLTVLGFGLTLLQAIGINILLLAPLSYGIVYMYMFMEHLRRVQWYKWSNWLCVTWFIYRLLIYPLVFTL
jgi:predicted DCC family thiol-disulfide oxidoreductase YuxK